MSATPALIPSLLSDYGAKTRSVLNDYLPKSEPREHLYDLVADYPARGGKMMRPSICIATTKALGGSEEDALLSAASIELFHNAMLIHDDIEDESEERRGRPTLHKEWGVPIAINVGDTLSLLSFRPLLDNHHRLGLRITHQMVSEAERVARESAEGQALELGWRESNKLDITEADYLNMVLKKTCWLSTIYPLRLGALIAGRGGIDLDRFIRYGFFLGSAFQIQDDLLNLNADTRYGKEHVGDLWEGKRTIPLIHLLENIDPKGRKRIEKCLNLTREEKKADDIEWIRSQMDTYASIHYASEVAQGLAGAAMTEFEHAFTGVAPSDDLEFLRGMATWVFERN